MKKLPKIMLLSVFIAIYSFSAPAQDRCSDALVNGTLQNIQMKSNNYIKMLKLFSFSQKTSDEIEKDTSFDAKVPLGKSVLEGDHNKSDIRKKQDEINSKFNTNLTSEQMMDIAVTSGDPVIINAWSQCMKSRGGLSLRYQVNNSTSVTAIIEWHVPPNSGISSVELSQDVLMPPVVDKENSELSCFRKGKALTAGASCSSTLTLRDAASTANIVIKAESKSGPVGDVSAFLAPRLRPVVERKLFDAGDNELCKSFISSNIWVKLGQKHEIQTCSIDPRMMPGWSFDPNSLQVQGATRNNAGQGSACDVDHIAASAYEAHYTLGAYSAVAGTQSCLGSAKIEITKEEWVPY